MSDLFEDLDLPGDSLNVLLVVDFVFLQDLDCHFLPGKGMLT